MYPVLARLLAREGQGAPGESGDAPESNVVAVGAMGSYLRLIDFGGVQDPGDAPEGDQEGAALLALLESLLQVTSGLITYNSNAGPKRNSLLQQTWKKRESSLKL